MVSFCGPTNKDKLHFFVAWDHQQDSRPLIKLMSISEDELRFNVTRATH
jgi:hypothetical protein